MEILSWGEAGRSPALRFARCFETQRHGGTEKWVWVLGWRLRELCDSVFPKSAQWLARGLILFFDTQRMKKGRGKIPRPFDVYRLFGEPCAKLALQLCR